MHSALKPEYGDAFIFGGSSIPQIEKTFAGLKRGPLDDETVKKINEVYETLKNEEHKDDNLTVFGKVMSRMAAK